MNKHSILHARWGIIYFDRPRRYYNLLMCPSPEDTYVKWRPFASIPFVVYAHNIPGAPLLFLSKEEAAAYIHEQGLDALQNVPYPVTIYIAKEDTK